ncbi:MULTISPECIES: Zn-ribbon domain-containing OB-fold protein [Halobacterium]|uniref:Zn-ribbon domain-containing OB-fold protein n=1 Tax=Halobacterium TaxID=2239 RepID=UPI00073E4CD7|nr:MULTISPECIES: Zn-ribbon domain-containing OB-fold protein [Halobacterium]MCG1003266.1 Zn-ribbon domain-containing OB-fold protein [Halobacterium noricense]
MTDTDSDGEPPRRTVSIPDRIELPRLLDFYDLQDAEHTRIHEFYDRLSEGDFSTTQCNGCGELHFPPRVVCPECTSDDLEYVSLPHEGTLFSFSTVRGSPLGMDTPFVTGVVELDGVDVRLSARIEDAEYEDLSIGDPVSLVVVDIEDSLDQQRVFYRFEQQGETA